MRLSHYDTDQSTIVAPAFDPAGAQDSGSDTADKNTVTFDHPRQVTASPEVDDRVEGEDYQWLSKESREYLKLFLPSLFLLVLFLALPAYFAEDLLKLVF